MAKEKIVFTNVSKEYNNKTVIDELSFAINENDFVTILGASGSGKTTTLKMINRLVEANSGTIEIDGQDIMAVDKINLRRNMGYVVQQVGLFPHMTVEKNIATVPELLGHEEDAVEARVKELMDTVQLPYAEFAKRFPNQLSGGQQQRIGVARALAANPPIMLLDEPFGALDAITRKDLQEEIKRLHATLDDKTFVFVTHDMSEAFHLGNKVIIMNEGRIEQYDTPQNIIKNPETPYVQQLLDTVYDEKSFWNELI